MVAGVLLDAGARPVARWSGLSRSWALTVVGGVLAIVLALVVWLAGSQLQSQFSALIDQLPRGLQTIESGLDFP